MYIYGAGGHAKVIIDILHALGINIDGIIDDHPSLDTLKGYPVVREKSMKSPVIIGIGDNRTRKEKAECWTGEFLSAIHPSAIVSPSASIQTGTVVMQGCIIQTDASIGRHCIINTGASVDHDCAIGDFAHIAPHATLCGNVTVGEGTWVGAGTTVIQGVKIGQWSMIGAGSVVVGDIPDRVLAFGNPCKVIKKL